MKKILLSLSFSMGLITIISTSAPYHPLYENDQFTYDTPIQLNAENRIQYFMIDLECYLPWENLTMIVSGNTNKNTEDKLIIKEYDSENIAEISQSGAQFTATLKSSKFYLGQHKYVLNWQGDGVVEITNIQFNLVSNDILQVQNERFHPYLQESMFYNSENSFCFGRISTCNCEIEDGADISKLADCDGDGLLYTEDCDECDPLQENNDCNENSEYRCFDNIPSSSINYYDYLEGLYDCDLDQYMHYEDCDDFNYTIGGNGDCDEDGVSSEEDCDDLDPTITNEFDFDCDGVSSEEDCDDNSPYIGNSDDCDGDGIPFSEDCDDSYVDGYYYGSIADDFDCDGIPTEEDCDDQNPTRLEYISHVGDLNFTSIEEMEDWYCLSSITGSLSIENNSITNLSSLPYLSSISNSLVIRNNPELQSFFNPNVLGHIGQSITIENNPKLCQSTINQFIIQIENNNNSILIENCCNDDGC